MNETTIMLSPSPGDPGVKPDFLATVEPVAMTPRHPSTSTSQSPQFTLPFEIVLDGYTRESWSSGKTPKDDEWETAYFVSTDGRNRLPGFFQYLQSRKKAAMAKFEPNTDAFSQSGSSKAMLVVPYDPPPVSSDELPDGIDKSQILFVKYLKDVDILKKGQLKKENSAQQMQQQQQKMQQKKQIQMQQQQQQKKMQQQKLLEKRSTPTKKAGVGGGLLGNLLGAQRRTENHLDMVRTNKTSSDPNAVDLNSGAAGVISSFRNKVSTQLEQFQNDPTTFVIKVPIILATMVQGVPMEEREKITMDVLKYVVYEQVEEIGMDKWVAAKEPGGFMDESVIAVYKEGHCPKEILEEMNKGDLPDEIKGQQRHLAESQSKAIQKKDKKKDELIMKRSVGAEAGNVAALNTNKRDRRTMEQIQKDMMDGGESEKRSRIN